MEEELKNLRGNGWAVPVRKKNQPTCKAHNLWKRLKKKRWSAFKPFKQRCFLFCLTVVSIYSPFCTMILAVTVRGTCLCSRAADVLHALDAADAAVGNFGAGQTYVVPETPLTVKPAARAYNKSFTLILLKEFFCCEALTFAFRYLYIFFCT